MKTKSLFVIIFCIIFKHYRDKGNIEPKKKTKGVKFADGIDPGYGTPDMDEEELGGSPPPPSILQREKLKLKKLKRKRDRAKRKLQLRKKLEPELPRDSFHQIPPPPKSPFPFCHPGILYQVCPQYAGEFYMKQHVVEDA